jgi:phospholipid/cholesterol/gamma-HCH transport system ATP-binding protein
MQAALFITVGLWGGSLSGSLLLGLESGIYWSAVERAVESQDVRECFTKAVVFGLLTIALCAYHGFQRAPLPFRHRRQGGQRLHHARRGAVEHHCAGGGLCDHLLSCLSMAAESQHLCCCTCRRACSSASVTTSCSMARASTCRVAASLTVLGRSGAGKSVLLKCLADVMQPDEGRISFEGRSASGDPPTRAEFRRRCSFLFQSNALFDSLTALENVALPLEQTTRLSDQEIHDRSLEALRQLELEAHRDRYPSQLSGGMQKRLALARAIVTKPELVLFDEPTAGLDPLRRNAVFAMIAKYQRQFGFTAVVVTHDRAEALVASDRVALLDNGLMCFEGTPAEFSPPRSFPWCVIFVTARRRLAALLLTFAVCQALNPQIHETGQIGTPRRCLRGARHRRRRLSDGHARLRIDDWRGNLRDRGAVYQCGRTEPRQQCRGGGRARLGVWRRSVSMRRITRPSPRCVSCPG